MNTEPVLPPPPNHKTNKRTIFLILGILLLLCASYITYFLQGWRLGELHFHKSWSEEARADMLAIDSKILSMADDCWKEIDRQSAEADEEECPGVLTKFMCSAFLLFYQREGRQALKHAAASGRAEPRAFTEFSGVSMAHLACRYGKTEFARELIRRGAKPSDRDGFIEESVLQAAISNTPYFFDTPESPTDKRIALLDFLYTHGSESKDFEPIDDSVESALNCALCDEEDKGQTLLWCMEHDMQLTDEYLWVFECLISNVEGSLPVLRKMHEEGLLQQLLQSPEAKAKMAWGALKALHHADSIEKLSWTLDTLGADPNCRISLEDDEDEEEDIIEPEASAQIHTTIINFCLQAINDAAAQDDDCMMKNSFAALELLLSHGATIPEEMAENYAPKAEKHNARYREILSKYGILLSPDEDK